MSSSELFIFFSLVLMSIVSSEVTTVTSEEYGITDVRKERLAYEWTIKHFSLLPQENGEYIESPIFTTENKDVEWRLRLYPRGIFKDDIGYASIYLMLKSQKAEKINVKVHAELTILKANHVYANETFDQTYDRFGGGGERKFILRSSLLDLTSLDDTFTIRAEVNMPFRIITEPFNVTDPLEQQMSRDLQKNRLNDNFGLLFDEAKFSDIAILVGTDKFPAHKLILCARSPVFESILKENQTSEMRVDKIETIVMKATLEFIYTDDVADLKPLVYGLLAAADRFELPRLKVMCEKVLYESLNEDNAANILVLTDLHRSHKLKERVIKFIANHLSAVMNTEGYRKMEDMFPNLLKELLHSVGRGNSKNSLCETLGE